MYKYKCIGINHMNKLSSECINVSKTSNFVYSHSSSKHYINTHPTNIPTFFVILTKKKPLSNVTEENFYPNLVRISKNIFIFRHFF